MQANPTRNQITISIHIFPFQTMYKRMVDAHETKPSRVDPEITLQFLKSAIYYFLTDKENSQGHLSAIESILGFSEKEKQAIDKARNSK